MKVIDYISVKAFSGDSLRELVKVYIGLGWELQGGVSVEERCFYQAMVKYENS